MNDVTDGDVEALRERIRRLEAMLAAAGTGSGGGVSAPVPAAGPGAGAPVLPAIPPHSDQVPEGQPPYHRTRRARFGSGPRQLVLTNTCAACAYFPCR